MNDSALNLLQPGPTRRPWLPALLGGAAVVCLWAVVWQTGQLMDQRRENAALRAATTSLDLLRQENEELQRLRRAAPPVGAREKNRLELATLRSEAALLLGAAQEIPSLRAEGGRLAAERAAAMAKAGVAAEVDPFVEAKRRAQRIRCISNIKQICLAALLWAHDQKEASVLPVSFVVMSNELDSPKILTCAADTARTGANTWQEFNDSRVSYAMLSPGADVHDAAVVYVRCPICNNIGLVDGSAHQLDPASDRVEKVDGKFKLVRVTAAPGSGPP